MNNFRKINNDINFDLLENRLNKKIYKCLQAMVYKELNTEDITKFIYDINEIRNNFNIYYNKVRSNYVELNIQKEYYKKSDLDIKNSNLNKTLTFVTSLGLLTLGNNLGITFNLINAAILGSINCYVIKKNNDYLDKTDIKNYLNIQNNLYNEININLNRCYLILNDFDNLFYTIMNYNNKKLIK